MTAAERRHQEKRLQPIIDRLWKAGVLNEARHIFLQEAHATLRAMRAAQHSSFVREYENLVVAFTGIGGLFDTRGGTQRQVPPPYVDNTGRQGYDWVMNAVLESVGLFDPNNPSVNSNLHYRVLAAHLLLWPEPLDNAGHIIEPFPWPWFVQTYPNAPISVYRTPDSTEEQKRIANRIETHLQSPERYAERMGYGSLPKKTESKPVVKSVKGMSAPRRGVAELAYNKRKLGYTYEAILNSGDFDQAQAAAGTGINTISGLHKLLRELYAATGWKDPKPRKE